jgi:hypothetical protein
MKVVLDTNVLENMLNPEKNKNGYLTGMVSKIIQDKRTLCLDEGQRIDKEYFKRLGQTLHNKKPTETIARQILGFFIALNGVPYPHKERRKVDKTDDLMKCIGRQIPIEEDLDRVMVYVAARTGATLVTDDYDHILSDDGTREERLKKCAQTYGSKDFDLMDSRSAKSTLDKLT